MPNKLIMHLFLYNNINKYMYTFGISILINN